MSCPVIWSGPAEVDRGELVDFLAQRSVRAALRFVDAIEAACNRLADFPLAGSVYESDNPRLDGLRVWAVPGFLTYLLFYRVAGQRVEIIRFVHGARDLENLPPPLE